MIAYIKSTRVPWTLITLNNSYLNKYCVRGGLLFYTMNVYLHGLGVEIYHKNYYEQCHNIYKKYFFRLKHLLSLYRIHFDFIDVVLANATSLKTTTTFTTLWTEKFVNQGICK